MQKVTPIVLLLLTAACTSAPAPTPDADSKTIVVVEPRSSASCVAPSALALPSSSASVDTPATSSSAAEAALDACGRAEKHLLELGCKDKRGRVIGGPNLHKVPWAQICRDDKKNGVDLKPDCLVKATSCKEMLRCK